MKRLPLISSFGSTPRRKLYIAIAAQMIASASAQAAPAGGTIVGGSGVIEQLGADTTIIQNTDRLAIDWDTFNIGAEERVQFIQPDADSIALNRILGNEASQIFGRLDANGHVILMNPNGVLFGESATVNVGGLVAAGLNINADDFINGEMVFQALEGKDGAVINQGIINAATGGNVALIGKQVDNQGLISAKLGSVTLAAGKEAVLTFDNQGLIGVRVSKEILQSELGVDAAVSNSGEITAEGGRVLLTGSASQDIFSQAVNADGLNAKTSVVMHEDGSFTLGAGADVVNTGTISTSSTTAEAGDIVVLGENVNSSGTILANSKTAAGDIEIHSRDTTLLTENSTTSAINDGAGSGGQIKILGDRVGILDQSQIDTSGTNGGGDINIGGGFQGKQTQLRNASRTAIGKDTLIEANATAQGDGGEVIVWADETTSFTGEINVRGGELGGDGGFVEVSGKENLRFLGSVDRTAVRGENGTLLLDPEDIFIVNESIAPTDFDDQDFLFDELIGMDLEITSTALSDAVLAGDVILEASNNIEFEQFPAFQGFVGLDLSGTGNTNSLILNAGRDITLHDTSTINLDAGHIVLNAGVLDCGAAACATGAPGTGGSIYLFGSARPSRSGLLNVTSNISTTGNVILRASDSITMNGYISSGNLDAHAGREIRVGDFSMLADGAEGVVSIINATGSIGLKSGDYDAGLNAGDIVLPNSNYLLPALVELEFSQSDIVIGDSTYVPSIFAEQGEIEISASGGINIDSSLLRAGGTIFPESKGSLILEGSSVSLFSADIELSLGDVIVTARGDNSLDNNNGQAEIFNSDVRTQGQIYLRSSKLSELTGTTVGALQVPVAGLKLSSNGGAIFDSSSLFSSGSFSIESGEVYSITSHVLPSGDTIELPALAVGDEISFVNLLSADIDVAGSFTVSALGNIVNSSVNLKVDSVIDQFSSGGNIILTGLSGVTLFEDRAPEEVRLSASSGTIGLYQSFETYGGSFSANADFFEFSEAIRIDTAGITAGNIDLISQQDIVLPTIVSGGDLNVESTLGSVSFSGVLNVEGDTSLSAAETIEFLAAGAGNSDLPASIISENGDVRLSARNIDMGSWDENHLPLDIGGSFTVNFAEWARIKGILNSDEGVEISTQTGMLSLGWGSINTLGSFSANLADGSYDGGLETGGFMSINAGQIDIIGSELLLADVELNGDSTLGTGDINITMIGDGDFAFPSINRQRLVTTGDLNIDLQSPEATTRFYGDESSAINVDGAATISAIGNLIIPDLDLKGDLSVTSAQGGITFTKSTFEAPTLPSLVSVEGDVNLIAGGDIRLTEGSGLNVGGETGATAGQDIVLGGDTGFNPNDNVFIKAGRIAYLAADQTTSGDLALADDYTSSFVVEAGSGIIVGDAYFGNGDFIASANNGMTIERLHTGGQILLRSVGEIDWQLGAYPDEGFDPIDSLEIYTDERIVLPAVLDIDGNFSLHAYSDASNLLSGSTFVLSDGSSVLLPELTASNVLEYDGRVDWWTSAGGVMATNGGDFFIQANEIDHLGAAVIDTSSTGGHGDITLIARDNIQAPPIRYSTATSAPQSESAKITIQAGRVLWDRDFDFNNAGVVDLNIASEGDVILGVIRGDQHDQSTDGLFGAQPAEGRFFDSVGGDADQLNIQISANGTVFQKYDLFTGGGNYTATASEFSFNDGVQINTDFSNTEANSLTGTGNISLAEAVTDFSISRKMILPNIRTQGDCLDFVGCGDLKITTNREVSDRAFGDIGSGRNIKVFGDASFNVGAIDLHDEINNIQFDGLVSVDAGYVSLSTKGGFTLGDWDVKGTAYVVAEDVEGRSSDLISSSSLNILSPAVFATNGDLILQGENTRFQSRAQLHARRVLLDHEGDLNLEGLFLGGGAGGERSIINVNGSVVSDQNSSSFVEPGSDRAFSLDIIGKAVDGFFQEASPVVFNVTGDLLLSAPDNLISSVQVINAQNVAISNNGNLILDGVNAESLSLNVLGDINQSDALNISGETLILADMGANIDLSNPSNDFNTLSVKAEGPAMINIADANSIRLADIELNGSGQGGALSITASAITQEENSHILLQDATRLNMQADYITLGADGSASVDIYGSVLNAVFGKDFSVQGVIQGAEGSGNSGLAGLYINGSAEENLFEVADGGSIIGEFREGSKVALGDGDDIIHFAGDVILAVEGGAGDDRFTIASPSISVANIIGNAGFDTLIGSDADTNWTLADEGLGTFTTEEAFGQFNGIERIEGGSGADQFIIDSAEVSVELMGGAGVDRLVANPSNAAINNQWVIDGDNSGSLNEFVVFSSVENLVGNDGADYVTFVEGAQIGEIRTGLGDDVVTLAANVAATLLDAGDGEDTLNLDGIDSIYTYLNVLIGGDADYTAVNFEVENNDGGSKTIVGVDGYNAEWIIDGDGSVFISATQGGVTETNRFAGVTRLEGASGDDTFILQGGNIDHIVGGQGGVDTIQASNAENFWQLHADGGYLNEISFAEIEILNGGSGIDEFILTSSTTSVTQINGGDGVSSLIAFDQENLWDINSIGSSLNSTLKFDSIANLVGGSAADSFVINSGGYSLVIDGGNGANQLSVKTNQDLQWEINSNDIQLSAPQIRLNVLLTNIQTLDIDLSESNFYINDLDNPLDEIKGGRLALHTFDFSRIEGALTLNLSSLPFGIADFNYSQIIGNGQQTEVVGDAVNTAWLIHDGFVEAITDLTWSPGFVNVGKIQGGSANDEFQVLTLSNAIEVDGGAGVNRLIAGASQNTVNINAAYSGTLNDNVIFSGIQEIDGGSGNDTFTFSPNSSIGNINAGAGDDTFILANNVTTGILDGGDGNDTLDRDSLNFVVTYLNELLEGDAVYTAANIETETFIGGSTTVVGAEGYDAQWTISGEGTLSVTATGSDGTIVTNQFAGVTRAEGGSGTDEFILLEGGALADGIFGNGGDSLQASDTTNTWKINSEDGGELAVGGSTLLFQGIANLIGGSGSDVFDIVTGGSITGSIDGGAGVDTLMISDASATNSWQLGAVNSVAQVARFQGIETITGNSGDDTFAFTGISDVTAIEGGEGNNRLLWNAGDLAVNLSTGLLNEEIQFSGISSFDADAAASNTLTGADAVNSWLVDGDAAGTVSNANGSVAFSGFQTLIGGAEADTFTLAAGVNIGEIYGGAGNDVFVIGEGVIADNLYGEEGDDSFEVGLGLTLSGVLDGGSGGETNGDTIDLSQFTLLDATEELESVVGFAFRNFERIEQPNNAGVYFGGNGTNFWYITGANEGRLEIRDGDKAGVYEFSGVHSLLGGEGEDVFIFANDDAAVSTLIDGGTGAGANTLDLSAQGLINRWLIDGTNSGLVSNSSNASGNVFTNIAYLIGGSNQDTFELHSGGGIDGGIDGGLGADELRVVVEQTSHWQLGGTGGHEVTGVASFTNIETLIGGAGTDNFDILAPLTDVTELRGGAGSDAVNFLYDTPVEVDLARGLAGGLLVEAIERFNSAAVGSTFRGHDQITSWSIDGQDQGVVDYKLADGDAIRVAFDGFGHLVGGAADDQFLFAEGGALSGTLEGGDGSNSVDLQALRGELHVAVSPEIAIASGLESLTLVAIDQLIGNGQTWLYGASDRSYTWVIDGARSGHLTSTLVDDVNRLLAFENLSAIRGGAHDDIFQVTTASPLLSLDGGEAVTADFVDYSQVNGNLSINLTDALTGQNGAISGVEGIRGNNAGPSSLHTAQLVGPDSGALWTIGGVSDNALADGLNDGHVTFGEQTVTFIDFNRLTGGAGVDTFNQLEGVILGTLEGGAGNDIFNVHLAGANAGTSIIGGAGVDSLILRGGDETGQMTYTAAANGGEFDYSAADVHYKLSHEGVETIRENSLATTLNIRGSSAVETFSLANGRFWVNSGDVIEYSNKRDLAVHSGINDIIEIADHLVLDNSLTLANGTVIANDPADNSITASSLVLDSVREVGLASARLRTNVDDLLVRNSAGDIYLQEQNGLNLAEFSANRVFDLVLLNGDLTNSAPLLAADVFRAAANNGDITLTGTNQLRDDVAVMGERVEIHNASTLTLIEVNAEDLYLRTQRGVEGDGPLRVAGLTDIDAQGDVLLDFATNDFNRVRVTNAVNLTLVDENAIELLDINASGKVIVRSTNAITLNDAVTGGNGVEISSGTGSINQNGDIATNSGSIVVAADKGEVNLDEDARIVANGGSVSIKAGEGDVNMGSDTRIAAHGGDVSIDAAGSVVVAEVVSSGKVQINAGGGNVSDGNGGATNVTAGELEVSANTGFGDEDALETEVSNIDITTNTGNVAVNNTGDVAVGKVSTGEGDISLANDGNVELGGGSVVAENGTNGGSVKIDVSHGSVSQRGSTQVPAVKSGGVVVINAPDGAVGEGGGLRVDAPFVEVIAAIKAGNIFVNPGADKIEYFSGSFKFDDQLLAVEPLDDINPAIFANVKSYSFNDISLLLPRDQLYDEDDEE